MRFCEKVKCVHNLIIQKERPRDFSANRSKHLTMISRSQSLECHFVILKKNTESLRNLFYDVTFYEDVYQYLEQTV